MMMPANFSAISENEMTYVNGGALADILADSLTVSNWKTFNTNMVTLIGNAYMQSYVNSTLGKLFNGEYKPGNIVVGQWNTAGDAWESGAEHGFTSKNETTQKFLSWNNGLLNASLNVVGNLAAIYNLATGTVKNAAGGAEFTAVTF